VSIVTRANQAVREMKNRYAIRMGRVIRIVM